MDEQTKTEIRGQLLMAMSAVSRAAYTVFEAQRYIDDALMCSTTAAEAAKMLESAASNMRRVSAAAEREQPTVTR